MPVRRLNATAARRSEGGQKPAPSGSKASRTRGPMTWATLGLFGLTGLGAIIYFNVAKQRQEEKARNTVQTVGKALLGGPFELVDTDGRPVTDKDYRGKFTIIYFGFTYCPDICPNELVKLGKALDLLDKRGLLDEVRPLFISVDPHRDTLVQIEAYLRDFHPAMKGLTGTPAQIKRVTKHFRVYFSDQGFRDDDDDDYVVDHSIVMYLMGPDGEFIDFFPQLTEAPEMAAKIEEKIRATQGFSVGRTFDGFIRYVSSLLDDK